MPGWPSSAAASLAATAAPAGPPDLVDDGDAGSGRLGTAQDPAEQRDDRQRGEVQQGQRARVAPELGHDAAKDGGHAKRVHRAASFAAAAGGGGVGRAN